MVLLITRRAAREQIKKMAGHFSGYIKVVVDVKKEILAGGADRHFEEEKALLDAGSKQKNLWGGGLDVQTGEIDYNSLINLRSNQDNPSRDVLDIKIRKKFSEIVQKLLS